MGVAEHFDSPASTYRAHKPWAYLLGTSDAPRYVVGCSLCSHKKISPVTWPCDASRMADAVLRPPPVAKRPDGYFP